MDYTDNFNFAQPEDGSSNSGQAINGNMDTIDKLLKEARSLIISRQGTVLSSRITGKVIMNRYNPD